MHVVRLLILVSVSLLLSGCSAISSSGHRHAADETGDAEMRVRLAEDVRAHMQAARAQTGIADMDPALFSAIADVPRHAFVPPQLKPFAYFDIPLPVDGDRHARYAGYTWGYNRTLLAERVRDVLAAIACARALPGTERVVVWGEGRAGTRALLAAALAGPAVDGVLIDAGWDFDRVASLDDPELLPGALRYGGLFAFAGLVAPSELLLCGRKGVPAITQACFDAAGAAEGVRAVEVPSLGALGLEPR